MHNSLLYQMHCNSFGSSEERGTFSRYTIKTQVGGVGVGVGGGGGGWSSVLFPRGASIFPCATALIM